MVFRKIVLRFFALTVLLIGMNFIYVLFFLENDLQHYAPIVNSIRAIPKDSKVLYIGESSNVTISLDDLDQRPISELLNEHYPSLRIAQLTQAAAHAGIFKTLLENVDPETDIETVVVTLNMRSFNAEWIYSGLETPLRKTALLLEDRPALMNRLLLSFKHYPAYTEKERFALIQEDWEDQDLALPNNFPYKNVIEWRNAVERIGLKNKRGERDPERTQLAYEYISAYAFRIDLENNPRIADLNDIVDLAKKRNWNLVFNLMAENTDMAQDLLGPELVSIMRDNRKLLVDYFSKKKVTVVDNLELIRNVDFVDKEWPTEHYNQNGRRMIAANLAQAMKKFHKNDYAPLDNAHFFNDCEGQLPWANLHTLTSENAASGKRSSRTDAQTEYSINFRLPFEQLPDKAKNTVRVKMMVQGSAFTEKTLLVLDIRRKNGEHYWKPIALNELTRPSSDWQLINHTFDLSPVQNDGEFIEIYIYNQSKKILYVDDIDILFQ